jgi:hypothetical protein
MKIKNSYIHFRVGPAERYAADILTEAECLNLSEMMRLLIREGLEKRNMQLMGLILQGDKQQSQNENHAEVVRDNSMSGDQNG